MKKNRNSQILFKKSHFLNNQYKLVISSTLRMKSSCNHWYQRRSLTNKAFSQHTTTQFQNRDFDFFLFSNKFINLLMIDGKKSKASTIFFEMLSHLKKEIEGLSWSFQKNTIFLKDQGQGKKEKNDFSVLQIVFQALNNVKPSLEVRKVRKAGSTYLVPCVLSKRRQETLALRWIIESARKKKKNSKLSLSQCLSDELVNASKKQGQARQKRDELHRLAQANRAYIRYRWW